MPTYRAWLRSTNRAAVLTREELQQHLRRGNVVQVSAIGERQPINNPPAPKPMPMASRNGFHERQEHRPEWMKRGRR